MTCTSKLENFCTLWGSDMCSMASLWKQMIGSWKFCTKWSHTLHMGRANCTFCIIRRNMFVLLYIFCDICFVIVYGELISAVYILRYAYSVHPDSWFSDWRSCFVRKYMGAYEYPEVAVNLWSYFLLLFCNIFRLGLTFAFVDLNLNWNLELLIFHVLYSKIGFPSIWRYPNFKSVNELIYKKGLAKIKKERVPLTDNNAIEQVLGLLIVSFFSFFPCHFSIRRCWVLAIFRQWASTA